jgi:hypothetical protein
MNRVLRRTISLAAAIGCAAAVTAWVAPVTTAGLLVTARDDAYTAVGDHALSVPAATGVLENDSGVGLTAAKRTNPAHGTVTVNSNGSFTYRPDAGYVGPDSFKYDARVLSLGILVTDTATVALTVTAPPPPPTPDPTPAPTPAPTPQPTPAPTAALTPAPTVRPTTTPLLPLPTVPTLPLPTLRPQPTATPAPSVRPTASPTSATTPTSNIGEGSSGPPVGGPAGPVEPPRGGSGSGPGPLPSSAAPAEPPFVVSPNVVELDVDTIANTFDGFEWAVPALVLTVPGLLIVIAVLAQSLIGLAWLPVARRWLGNDRRRRPAFARVGDR